MPKNNPRTEWHISLASGRQEEVIDAAAEEHLLSQSRSEWMKRSALHAARQEDPAEHLAPETRDLRGRWSVAVYAPPEELAAEIEQAAKELFGPRGRSEFIRRAAVRAATAEDPREHLVMGEEV